MQPTTQSQSFSGNLSGVPSVLTLSTLYVGDLNKDVREEDLFQIFSQVGPIASIRVLRDHISRVSLGYAYVNFTSAQIAEEALQKLNHCPIKGRPLRLMWKQRDPFLRKSGEGNVFIKNLDTSFAAHDFADAFSSFGTILSSKLATTEDGKSRGFGFVQFQTREEAEKAIEGANGKKLTETQSLPLIVAHHVRSQPKTASFTNLLVKNIRDDVTDEQLAAAFVSCGSITSAVVARDASGKSKRHGFCNFETPESAARCIELFNDSASLALPDEKIIVVRHLKLSDYIKERNAKSAATANQGVFQDTNVYVRHLDSDVTDSTLREMFSVCGTVTSAKVAMARGVSRGFGYVNFSTAEEAAHAVTTMNARAIKNSKPLYVSLFMDRNTRLQMRLMNPAAYGRAPHMLQPLQSFPVFPGMMAGALHAHGGPQFFQNRWRPVGHMLPAQGRMAIWPPRAAAAAPARPAEQPKAVFQQQARNIPSAAPAAPVAPVAAAPAPNKIDLAAMLAQATPQDQKQMLGERLYALITPTHAQLAGKITAMLLDGLDTAELLGVIESRAALDKNIKLAVEALQQHSKKG